MRLITTLCSSIDHKYGCGNITEHTISGHLIRCTEPSCGYERPMPNELINRKLRDNAVKEQNLRGALMMLQEEDAQLQRMLIHVPQEAPKDPWKQYDTPLPCTKCGRKTRWAYNVKPLCRDGCPSVAPRPDRNAYLSNRGVRDLVNEMFSDDDPADNSEAPVEIIKHISKEAR